MQDPSRRISLDGQAGLQFFMEERRGPTALTPQASMWQLRAEPVLSKKDGEEWEITPS